MTIDNYSLLSPNKFAISSPRFGDFIVFAQSIIMPEMNLGAFLRPTSTKIDIWTPGDKIVYSDLVVTALLDEDLKVFDVFQNWYNDIAISENKTEQYTSIDIILLTNNSNANRTFRIHNCFPYVIPPLNLSTTQDENTPVSLDITFKLTHFELLQA